MKTLFDILFIMAILWFILMFGMFFIGIIEKFGIIEKSCLKTSAQMIEIQGKKVDALICETNPPKIIKIF